MTSTTPSTSNYEMITTSQDPVTRIIYARSDAQRRRRERTLHVLKRVGVDYWSRSMGLSYNDSLSELAEELALALIHICEDARSGHNIDYLVRGIEQHMFTPPKAEEYIAVNAIIHNRIKRFEDKLGWTQISDRYNFDFEPLTETSEEESEGMDEADDDIYDGYDASTINKFLEELPELDAAELQSFGWAIAAYGWRHDPKESGLGSPLMVALIAYLRVFGPMRESY